MDLFLFLFFIFQTDDNKCITNLLIYKYINEFLPKSNPFMCYVLGLSILKQKTS